MGLVKAIDRFDPERGIAFSSYAADDLGEIKRYFRDRTWSVRVPRDLQELALKVDGTVSKLSLALNRQPSVAEIATSVGVDEEPIIEALEAYRAYNATSLQTPRGGEAGDDDTLGDMLGTEELGFARAEQRATLRGSCGSSPPASASSAPALRARPHPVGDRRAGRPLADAGLTDPSSVTGPTALRSRWPAKARTRARAVPSGRSREAHLKARSPTDEADCSRSAPVSPSRCPSSARTVDWAVSGSECPITRASRAICGIGFSCKEARRPISASDRGSSRRPLLASHARGRSFEPSRAH